MPESSSLDHVDQLIRDAKAGEVPRHIAIIMDGNGRWAQSRDLPRIEGHRHGVSTVRMVSETATEIGVDTLTLYCLSSENWKRPQAELDFLMHLLEQYLIEERKAIMEQSLRLQVIGRRDRLPENVLQQMDRTISMSEKNPGTRLVLAIDYGGRDEITQAVRKIADKVQSGEINISAIDENTVNDHLYTSALPEVDLLIRTGGDLRVSNFLLWQLSYAEFWMTEKCWPEFTKEDFVSAMIEFSTRQRRFGGLNVNE